MAIIIQSEIQQIPQRFKFHDQKPRTKSHHFPDLGIVPKSAQKTPKINYVI
jgi:hypothetical protein